MVAHKNELKRFAIASIGECMIELQEIEPGKTQQTFGGDTLNSAIYMARLDPYFPSKIDYVTALGCDSFSDGMVDFWEKEGVGSSQVLRQEGEMPGLYYIQLDENGERHFSYWRGEAAVKRCFEYDTSQRLLDNLEQYDAIYLSGISIAILTATSRANLYERLSELAHAGTKIYLDYNYRPHLWESVFEATQIYEKFLLICSTVFVGADELLSIHGVSSKESGHKFLASKGVQESVIRNGAESCSIFSEAKSFLVEAEADVKVVDTTAAGDSFSGAYLLARSAGCEVEQAAKIAHRMAAYVIRHKGAIAPADEMPDFHDLLG